MQIFRLIASALASLCVASLSGQQVRGLLMDKSSGEAVSNASVLESANRQITESDASGKFQFDAGSRKDKTLTIKCLGYEPLTVKVSQFPLDKELVLEMSQSVSELKQAEVQIKKDNPLLIIRRVGEKVPQNYLQGKFNYKMTYSDKFSYNGKQLDRNAQVLFFDKRGYSHADIASAYLDRNYTFTSSKRNFEVRSITEGTTLMEEFLQFDIVRTRGNVLDPNRMLDYEYTMLKDKAFGKDTAWAIKFKCKKPAFVRCGDWHATGYEGTIYVSQNTYALLQYDAAISTSVLPDAGRGMAADTAGKKQALRKATYKISALYTKQGAKYALSSISYNSQPDGRTASLTVDAVITDKPVAVEKRDFLERIPKPAPAAAAAKKKK